MGAQPIWDGPGYYKYTLTWYDPVEPYCTVNPFDEYYCQYFGSQPSEECLDNEKKNTLIEKCDTGCTEDYPPDCT